MRGLRSHHVRAMALVGALVLAVGGAGIAVAASGRPSSSGVALLAATTGDGSVVADRPTTTVAPTPTTGPVTPTTRVAPVTATTLGLRPPVRPTTSTTAAPGPQSTVTTPPTTAQANPASWSLDENGVSVRLRMMPVAPHVGDTVEFVIETWATVPTDACCITLLYVGQDLVYSRFHEAGPGCPVPTTPREHRVSYTITGPEALAATAPLMLNIHVQASRVDLCTAPPRFTTVNFFAPVAATYPRR